MQILDLTLAVRGPTQNVPLGSGMSFPTADCLRTWAATFSITPLEGFGSMSHHARRASRGLTPVSWQCHSEEAFGSFWSPASPAEWISGTQVMLASIRARNRLPGHCRPETGPGARACIQRQSSTTFAPWRNSPHGCGLNPGQHKMRGAGGGKIFRSPRIIPGKSRTKPTGVDSRCRPSWGSSPNSFGGLSAVLSKQRHCGIRGIVSPRLRNHPLSTGLLDAGE